MNDKTKLIIKLSGISIGIFILIILCILVFNREDAAAPVLINPVNTEPAPVQKKIIPRTPPQKPVTRDENQMPKSDYKVPEIG